LDEGDIADLKSTIFFRTFVTARQLQHEWEDVKWSLYFQK